MIYDPCDTAESVVNTAVGCAKKLGVTGGLILGNTNFRFTKKQVDAAPYNGNLTEFLRAQVHAAPGQRIFPIFGNFAPVNDITEGSGSDTIETLPNGAEVFVKDRMYNRTFITIEGGLCLAEKLMRLNLNGFMEIDLKGQILVGKYGINSDGDQTFGFITTNMLKGLAPTLATFTTSFKNNLMISFSPNAYVLNSALFATSEDENVLGLQGLLDADVTGAVAPVTSGGTAPTGGTTTITASGAAGSSIQITIPGVGDVSGTVTRVGTQTTAQLATAIAAAVTAKAFRGITATAATGVVTYAIPAAFGAALNTVLPVANIIGDIAATEAAFTGGVDGTIVFAINVKTECAGTDLIAAYPGTTDPGLVQLENFIVKKNGTVITPTAIALNGNGKIAITVTGGAGTYTIQLAAPAILRANGVEGYDTGAIYTVLVP